MGSLAQGILRSPSPRSLNLVRNSYFWASDISFVLKVDYGLGVLNISVFFLLILSFVELSTFYLLSTLKPSLVITAFFASSVNFG